MFPTRKKVSHIIYSILLPLITILSPSTSHKHHDQPPKLIVISFDGFKWDYLDFVKNNFNYSTPNFDRLINGGVTILNDGVLNAFVTKTFPNHYSIATGRYEENHGIVGNSFYDPLFNETFDISSPDGTDSKWWDGKSGKPVEPIWITNQKCGCNGSCECERYSGVVFWPGSDVEGQHPTHFLPYNKSMDFKDRLIRLLEWFSDEKSPINFGMMYFNEPDSTGHEFGPNSTQIAEKIVELDKLLGEFLEMLKEKKLISNVNIIITSDHGMVNQREVIILSDYIDVSLFQIYGTSLVFNILPKSGHLEEVYKILNNISHLIVFKKEHIPAGYHYQNNRRILDLVLTVEEGYRICMFRNDSYCMSMKGDHGYNNSLKSMHPIFIASGPAFKVNYQLEHPFEIVDLYPLMCNVLKLPPHDNDGDFNRVESILNIKRDVHLTENLVFISLMLFVTLTALTYSVCVCYHHSHYLFSGGITTDENKYSTLRTSVGGGGIEGGLGGGVKVAAGGDNGGAASAEGRKHLLGPADDEDDDDDLV